MSFDAFGVTHVYQLVVVGKFRPVVLNHHGGNSDDGGDTEGGGDAEAYEDQGGSEGSGGEEDKGGFHDGLFFKFYVLYVERTHESGAKLQKP